MADREVFDHRLARLESAWRCLRKLAATEREVYVRDLGLQAQAERWLHVAAQCCLDVAHHMIADHVWNTPASPTESFAILETEGVLDHDLAVAMQGWAGLRNILAHLYLDVDHTRVHGVLTGDLAELEAFAAAVTRFTRSP